VLVNYNLQKTARASGCRLAAGEKVETGTNFFLCLSLGPKS